MESVRAVEKRVAKKKQVYKPILDNPYTNEAELWPHVREQGVVVELLLNAVLRPLRHARELGGTPPFEVHTGYNDVMERLGRVDSGAALLFVCTRDTTPAVLLSQVPLAAHVSAMDVTVVQLPSGTLARFDEHLSGTPHDGLLLVPETAAVDAAFVQKVRASVEQRDIPWLEPLRYKKAPVKLLRTVMPLRSTK
ncbi:AaceriAFR348Cp [[Ashbya] aceris (nom. inval.)]|nr:AaceriAFR348Cp [[Ashbya] aceris (nom. inval.)]